jgi:hypothetical protein
MTLTEKEKRKALAKQAALNKLSGNPYGNDYDYDNFRKYNNKLSENGHATDQFKLPNHPTFSDQSDYSSLKFPGGTWNEIKNEPKLKGITPEWSFTPSQQMLDQGSVSMPFLKQYMAGPAENGMSRAEIPLPTKDPVEHLYNILRNEKKPKLRD